MNNRLLLILSTSFFGSLSLTHPALPIPLSTTLNESTQTLQSAQLVINETCRLCHNDVTLLGNLSLESFQVQNAVDNPRVAEKIIRKVRAGMMPPPEMTRPSEESLTTLAIELESRLDEIATRTPIPGWRSFQRLNRAEYASSIRDLLGLDIRPGDYLPPDTKSANFDNIADAQLLSTTLMEGYLRGASELSRLAIGDRTATPRETTYQVTRWNSQTEHVQGAPHGTRGGISILHHFPADGHYRFRVSFHHETTGALHGSGPAALHTLDQPEQIEISVNGEPVALMDIDRWMHVSDPDGVNMQTNLFFVRSGPQRVSAAFIRRLEGPVQDIISPHDWSIASTSIADSYGFTTLPHLRDLAITGPFAPTGVSEMPSRQKIFTCRPSAADETLPCAEQIIHRLARQAYRRPLISQDLDPLMLLYEFGNKNSDFESGIRTALEGILASPHFVFRLEEPPRGTTPGEPFRIHETDLASRLSFFLWGSPPDEELTKLAEADMLSNPKILKEQVSRMLVDSRSNAIATRFASQWLRLPDLDKMHPNVRTYPDFHEQLKKSMRRETELFFASLVQENRSVLELLTADYTFLDERLAAHYNIPNVFGNEMRRVSYPDDRRRGILAHGSILTLTSHASRTSPVLRGKWILEVLLGSPPPPPPPNVPELEEIEENGGRLLSVREQMEKHRSDPACNSCHKLIDPPGLALEHFDVTGAWRIRDNGILIDPSGELYDGTPLYGARDLTSALLKRETALIRSFIENLMAYALGRRVAYYDMPAIRTIERDAAQHENRMSYFFLGVVNTLAFQMKGPIMEYTDLDDIE